MLDRDALERLEGFIATAKQPGDLPWALIESDVANWLAANGDELLRVYRAWLDAPRCVLIPGDNPASYEARTLNAHAIHACYTLKGNRVRLVRDGDSGEGES